MIHSIVSDRQSLTYEDLVERVESVDEAIGDAEVRNTLIRLEIWGNVDVITEGKTTRIVHRGNSSDGS